MATTPSDFALYCCEILSSAGPCTAKRMFGGWGISTDGLTVAILANLGQGDTLWLKVNEDSKPVFEAQGCARFTYEVQGQLKGMNYYAAPADAMESPALMAPWARLALQAALSAQAAKQPKKPRVTRKPKTPVKRG
jgi:DNA transformation protein